MMAVGGGDNVKNQDGDSFDGCEAAMKKCKVVYEVYIFIFGLHKNAVFGSKTQLFAVFKSCLVSLQGCILPCCDSNLLPLSGSTSG